MRDWVRGVVVHLSIMFEHRLIFHLHLRDLVHKNYGAGRRVIVGGGRRRCARLGLGCGVT